MLTMTNFPNQPNPFSGQDMPLPGPERTSVLAVSSLVCSLICCFPGLGAIGVLLGTGGLFAIMRSNGRLSGRAFAIVGIVVGLIITIAQVGLVIGIKSGFDFWARSSTTVATTVSTGDVAQVRPLISPSATITDEQIRLFGTDIKDKLGAIKPQPDSLMKQWSLFSDFMQRVQQNARAGSPPPFATRTSGTVADMPGPVIVFDKGLAWIMFKVDTTQKSANTQTMFNGNLLDVTFFLSDGTLISLSNAGAQPAAPAPGTPPPPAKKPKSATPAEKPADEPAPEKPATPKAPE